jgi:hypothetical protein
MPRYSVIVEITRDVVVDARSANAARKKVDEILMAAQAAGNDDPEWQSIEPLYSMDIPEVYQPAEVVDDYVSGSGDGPYEPIAKRKKK